ncbi:MAG: hypothetical protein ACXWCY_21215 [Burkholderiales bacterium]
MFKKIFVAAAVTLTVFAMGCASGGSRPWGHDGGTAFPAQQVCNATG